MPEQQELDRLYRQHARSVTAALVRHLGPGMLDLIDTAVQDAFAKAANHWSAAGPPESPVGWLIMAARNCAVDQIRHRKQAYAKADDIAQSWLQEGEPVQTAHFEAEIADDELRMIFVCCDPALSLEAQIPLALRTLCGFPVEDIAAALAVGEDAIAKRLTRARTVLRREGVALDVPGDELPGRLEGVLAVLYGLFAEGYASHLDDRPLRPELCNEAIRLAGQLTTHRRTDDPRCHALLALMLLQRARLPARTDTAGALLTLADQDRSRWDHAALAAGLASLKRAAAGDRLHRYHIEAAIAACHVAAPTFAATDWPTIANLYGQLMQVAPSAVVAVNRAVATAMAQGVATGLAMLHDLARDPANHGYLLDAALGELYERQGHLDTAIESFRAALAQAPAGATRLGLTRRIADLTPRVS